MRTVLIIVLLLVSHGATLWLGKRNARPVEAPADTGSTVETTAPAKPLRMEDFLPPPPEEEDEPAPAPQEDYKVTRAREMKALRDAIPADADVEAMVRAGAVKDGMIDDKTLAAFGVWMDRDPLAAMRWHREWTNGASTSHFGFELRRHFEEGGGLARMNEYLAAIPEARWTVLGPIKEIARERGNDFLMETAGKLESRTDKMALIQFSFRSTDGLAPHLAALRGMLNEDMHDFILGQIAALPGSLDLVEDVRAAGFSEEALERFTTTAGKAAEAARSAWRSKPEAQLEELQDDFADGRLSGDEFVARVIEGAPDAAAQAGEVREFVFRRLLRGNPAKAIMWLQGHGGDWQQAVAAAMQSNSQDLPLSAEESLDITAGFSEADQESSGMATITAERFGRWYRSYPEQALAAARTMPEGSLKQRVLAEMKGGNP